MRVWSAVLVLVVLVAADASAQEVSWGLKGGVNFATLDTDSADDPPFKYRIGFVGGGFLTWPLTPSLDIQPEALVSQQGAGLDVPDVEPVIKLSYLATPILVRYKLHPPGGNGLVIFGGPSLGFKLSAKVRVTASGTTTTDDISDEIKGVDYGVVFGGGWEAGRLSIDGRYTWGLSAIGKEDTVDEKTTNRVISVMAGIRF